LKSNLLHVSVQVTLQNCYPISYHVFLLPVHIHSVCFLASRFGWGTNGQVNGGCSFKSCPSDGGGGQAHRKWRKLIGQAFEFSKLWSKIRTLALEDKRYFVKSNPPPCSLESSVLKHSQARNSFP
jgi:hypothetical protein